MFSLDGVSAPIEVPTNRDTVFNGSFSDSLKLAGWTLSNHSGEGSLKFTDGKVLLQAGEKTFSVYNMKGVFVCKLKATYMGEVQAQLNAMNLDKGLYVVKTGDFSRIFPVK